MEHCMPRARYDERSFGKVTFNDCVIDGEFTNCDFSEASMTRVEFRGTFTNCNFKAQEGVTRQHNDLGQGSFIRCQGLSDLMAD